MPQFDAVEALTLLQQTNIDVPFIIVSGTISEEIAVEAMRRGADDFMTKGKLSRLGPAIERELAEAAGRRERRRVEKTLAETRDRAQFALEAAGVGTWESDLATGATRWSQTLEQLHGLPPGGFPGRFDAFVDLIDAEDRQRVSDEVARADREGGDSHLEYRVKWPDGSVHWIAGIGRTLRGADGQPVKAAGIALDITSRKQLEEQFRQSQKMEAIGRLAGGIAHDFNNLLTAIMGYSEMVLDRVADQPDIAADVEEIKKAGERASRLTSQLLAFSRRQTIQPRILDLNQVVGDLERMLRRVIGEDIVLEIASAPGLARTKADPSQVEQVLMNLVVNARDAMPRGGRLRIGAANVTLDEAFARHHVSAVPGRYVSLTVTDTGSGMKPEIVARIFEPFFTTKVVGKGTGLGLSTVYGIVKQNNGYVTVDSTPGAGTTFTTYWPEVDLPVETPGLGRGPVRTLAGTETVLLVEDEAGVRELVRKILVRHGYTVFAARDAADAIDIEQHYDGPLHLLLTDIVMPGMNGPDLAQRLVRRRPDMQVMYMSGFAHHVAVGFGSVSDRTSFIQKPFSAESLAATVRDCLDRSTGAKPSGPVSA
jgi:PAS domain S-box-containing protein